MQLTPEQEQKVREWIKEGCGLAEIQKRIHDEFKLSPTFMDVRLLVLDLGVEIKDKQSAAAPQNLSAAAPTDNPDNDDMLPDGMPGAVKVDIDRVVKAGAVASGTVVFSDGVKAAWSLDHMGRLGLIGPKPGYRPAAEDVQSFQEELGRLLQRQGY